MKRLIVLFVLFACPAFARPIAAPDLTDRAFREMADPALIDRAPTQAAVERLARNVRVLRRMIELVGDRREQRVLRGHLGDMEADLAALEVSLKKGYLVRAKVPRKDLRRRPRLPLRPVAPPPPEMVDPKPMPDGRFASFLGSIDEAAFSEDKLSLVRRVGAKNHFSTRQVRQVMEKMSFGKDQRATLVTLYPRMVDPDSAHTLLSVMAHTSDRRKAQAEMDKVDAENE